MNIYDLSKKEVVKMHNEFNKTDYGFRAKFFSIFPIFAVVISLKVIIVSLLEEDSVTATIGVLGIIISLIGLSITQLQYGNMLKKYVESKDKEENK